MQLRRLVAITAVALAATTSLAACGSSEEEEPHAGKTEGVYVNTGELKYQVQISRQLTPKDFEDRDYLVGLPAGEQLARGEEWFGVFIRVFNKTDEPHPAASDFKIRDTTGKEYEPVALDTNVNRTAFRPAEVGSGDQIPVPGSQARENLTQGGLLLFKVNNASYDSRPLELEITPPEGGQPATVDLDV